MKHFFQLLLMTSLGLNLTAQTWVNFDFTVPMEKAELFNANWAEFMNTETGKSLPTCFMSQHEMGAATHNTSISFVSDDVQDMAPLFDYQAIFQNPDFMKMYAWFGMNVEPTRQQTGVRLMGSTAKEGNFYQGFWGIEVADPMATAAAFAELVKDSQPILDELNVEIALHQAMAGQEGAISHYISANFKDYATFMTASQTMYQSEGFGKFAQATAANRNSLTWTRANMNAWNLPE